MTKYIVEDDLFGIKSVTFEDGTPVDPEEVAYLFMKVRNTTPAWVYVFEMRLGEKGKVYKIGSTIDLDRRLKQLTLRDGSFSMEPEYIHALDCTVEDRYKYEKSVQHYFKSKGRWISREEFLLTKDDIEFICAHETAESFQNAIDREAEAQGVSLYG